MSRAIEPRFLDGGPGRIFVLLRRNRVARGCVLFVPPFAEEMNRSRRQVTETAVRLTNAGYSVIVPDLFGTGDSDGEFNEATWSRWLDDIAGVVRWAATENMAVDSLIATRLGCILAAEALGTSDLSVQRSVFWQPAVDGRNHMRGFLRFRSVAAKIAGNDETVDELRRRLAAGEQLEVSGYRLSPELFAAIEARELRAHVGGHLGNVLSIGIVRNPTTMQSSPDDEAQSVSFGESDIVAGQPFWAYAEAPFNASLCDRTMGFLQES